METWSTQKNNVRNYEYPGKYKKYFKYIYFYLKKIIFKCTVSFMWK